MSRSTSANALRPWLRWLLLSAAWSLLLSGVLWWILHDALGPGADGLPSPIEPWLMRWHGAAVVAGLYALGAISGTHVPRGWAMRRHRRTGAVLLAAWGLLATSGWALSYLTPESWRTWVGTGHALVGVAAFLIGVVHARWP